MNHKLKHNLVSQSVRQTRLTDSKTCVKNAVGTC